MPLEMIESTDPFAALIRFEISPVFELILSQHLLLKTKRRADWAQAARKALPAALQQELNAVYGPYMDGFFFFELGVACRDHNDVPGFIADVRAMDPVEFVFYLTGRTVTLEALRATRLEPAAVRAALAASPYGAMCLCHEVPFDAILADVPAFQRRLTDLWQWYWEVFFREETVTLRPHWEAAVADKQAVLAREGGLGLFEHITGKRQLPPPLPAEIPVREIVFVPTYLSNSSVFMFYGYGNVTVLFDSERTQARSVEIALGKERALALLKALGDSSRLDLLRVIAQHEGRLNGKKIAEHLNLSASAVSRHLAQLKDAGVILEETGENRAVTYRLQWDALTELPDLLREFLMQ